MKIRAQVKRVRKEAKPLKGNQDVLIRNAARIAHEQYCKAFRELAKL